MSPFYIGGIYYFKLIIKKIRDVRNIGQHVEMGSVDKYAEMDKNKVEN